MDRIRLHRLVDEVRTSLWMPPTLAVALAYAAALLLMWIDTATGTPPSWLTFPGGPTAAREVVATIAGATMNLIAVVFSITIVALQLASSQFSPRVLRTFLRDPLTKAAIGTFVGTFTYSLVLLDRMPAEGTLHLAITGTFVLALVSVGMLIAFLNNVSQSIRVVSIIDSVARETARTIEEQFGKRGSYPPPAGTGADDPCPEVPQGAPRLMSSSAGVLVTADYSRLARVAARHDCLMRVDLSVGDFVRRRATLVRVIEGEAPPREQVEDCFELAKERTMQQDAGFGFRQLVDIAERALSPGINDPTTAVQCLDRLHDMLGELADREFPRAAHCDDDGRPRVWALTPTWEGYVGLAVDEIRLNSDTSLQVFRRLYAMLRDLERFAPHGRVDVLRRKLDELDTIRHQHFDTLADEQYADDDDMQGHGRGDDEDMQGDGRR